MKSLSLMTFIALAFISEVALADILSSKDVETLYSKSSLPDFTPWIGKTIPGRCFFKTPKENKTASVLVPTLRNGKLFVAPLSADKRDPAFFDELSFEEIFNRFPQTERLLRPVYANDVEAIIYRQKEERNYEARIRQLDGYIFVKVILLNQEVRYCFYITKDQTEEPGR